MPEPERKQAVRNAGAFANPFGTGGGGRPIPMRSLDRPTGALPSPRSGLPVGQTRPAVTAQTAMSEPGRQ
jgi:hypothetical protein